MNCNPEGRYLGQMLMIPHVPQIRQRLAPMLTERQAAATTSESHCLIRRPFRLPYGMGMISCQNYADSHRLRAWCKQNRNRCYVPSNLLGSSLLSGAFDSVLTESYD